MSVRRFTDLEALSSGAADDLAALIHEAVEARGACRIALAGGSTPRRLYEQLAKLQLPWDRLDLWWGDERTVPAENVDSNYRMVRVALFDVLGTNTIERVHRIAGEHDPVEAAAAYERELVGVLGVPPVLDVVLLGLGVDGHTASLFPGSPALAETSRWVVATEVSQLQTTRITLTAPALRAARHIRFLVAGADKAAALAAVLEGPRDPDRYPAQLVADAPTDVTWLVDDAAAAELRSTP
ncbi:MAG: 6-phosphogluconolactonase [Deltaproteobacteria bacterium]|nr:6-phosphogluconolactonase [Deltaproteobacteria bacterium]